jgi:hypothetical protein
MPDWMQFLLRPTIALLLSPLGLVLIAATRLLIISDDRPATASAIASSGGYFNVLLGTLIPLVPIFIPYVAVLLLIFRRFLLSALAFMAAAFISPVRLYRPVSSILPTTQTAAWHDLLNWINANKVATAALVFILACILVTWITSSSGFQWFSFLWIVVAAIIFLPIVAPIYPIPRAVGFYVTMLRQPWLPSERITLTSGQVEYGYTLATSGGWFVMLTAGSRTIRYIPAREVATRVVCQQLEESFSPLIPLPPTTPAQVAPCLRQDGPAPPPVGAAIPRTRAMSYLSHGESLSVISSSVHVSPEAILSETNAYQHQLLSAALRAYEIAGDWNAATPFGQHFWYYPPGIS